MLDTFYWVAVENPIQFILCLGIVAVVLISLSDDLIKFLKTLK